MKKRFFAGLLACLMVVGLLPLSMLLKPVSAKAASEIYKIESTDLDWLGKTASSVTNTYKSGDFTFEILKNAAKYTGKYNCKDTAYTSSVGLKFGGGINKDDEKNAIKFKVNSKAKVRIWWRSNGNYIQCISASGKEEDSWKATNKTTKSTSYYDEISVKPGEYYVGSAKSSIYIYKIEVEPEEEAETSYKVTINDGTESKTETVKESAEYKITAKGTNFLYWVNSYGRIVSREAEYSFPVYYSDTYTAVYETEETKVNYLTAYGKIVKSISKSEFNVSEEQAGPVRYGYEFTGWDKTNAEISKLLEEGSVDVNPIYESDSKKVYDITIDTSALGGSKTTKSDCVINTSVTASTTSDDFAYWEDEAGNKLSYNPTYTFFATRALSVIAVSKEQEKDTTTEKALITKVYSEEENTVAGTKVVIFEYTVPVDYTMNFAGVIASKDSSEVTVTSTTNKYGDYSEKYKTYRYTVTKNGTDTWYIMPVLTYTANGETKTINGDMVTLK